MIQSSTTLIQSDSLIVELESIESALKGISAIDRTRLYVRSLEEADAFIKQYGYDWHSDEDRGELLQVFQEACSFIERLLLPEPQQVITPEGGGEYCVISAALSIPDELKSLKDLRTLLLAASDRSKPHSAWACAILKVMHTICHVDNTLLYQLYDEAKDRILSRYNHVIHQDSSGEVWLGTQKGLRLQIVGMEVKDKKSRDSMILKLLCKKENVAETLFDLIGVRIITHTVSDTLLALEILRQHQIIMFTNVIPSRSRNSLVDFDQFKDTLQATLAQHPEQHQNTSLAELFQSIPVQYPPIDKTFNPENPSSLTSYRAIHVTERPLIRYKFPGTNRTIRFYFPYELQLVDLQHHHENMSGQSAHLEYKRNKIIQARKRVLGNILDSPQPSSV